MAKFTINGREVSENEFYAAVSLQPIFIAGEKTKSLQKQYQELSELKDKLLLNNTTPRELSEVLAIMTAETVEEIKSIIDKNKTYLKFPKLSNRTEELLDYADKEQEKNGGKKNEEFPDNQFQKNSGIPFKGVSVEESLRYDVAGLSEDKKSWVYSDTLNIKDLGNVSIGVSHKLPPQKENRYKNNPDILGNYVTEDEDWLKESAEKWIQSLTGEISLKEKFAYTGTICKDAGKLSENAGIKHNQQKLPLDIVISRQFPKAIQAIALGTVYGHHKYKETDETYLNFKNVKGGSQTYADASQRHNLDKNSADKESNLPHIFMKLWNVMAETELWMEENKFDLENFTKKFIKNLDSK